MIGILASGLPAAVLAQNPAKCNRVVTPT